MQIFSTIHWICFYILLNEYIQCEWPLLNNSSMNLLGLFATLRERSEYSESSKHARAMFQAAIVLSKEYNITINGQSIGWKFAQTEGDPMDTLRQTCQFISTSNIVGIVGPQLSRECHFIGPFAEKIHIPVISYAATDPELSNRQMYPAFYRTIPSDNAAALALTKLFSLYNWTSCIVIYQNDAFGSGGIKVISEAFSNGKIEITEVIVFDVTTLDFQNNLKQSLRKSRTRIVLVWGKSYYTQMIVQKAIEDDVLGPQFTWILTSDISLENFDRSSFVKLNGMLIVEPVVGNLVNAPINKTLLESAYKIWETYEPESFPSRLDEIDRYALFAFDATWTLIQALKQLCSLETTHSSCLEITNTSFCFDRHVFHSTSLMDIITNQTFLGVTGVVKFSEDVTDRTDGIYHLTKNLQHSSNKLNSVPVLFCCQSNGWVTYTQNNVIIWPGNLLASPSGYANVVGVHLRIAIIESAPFTIVKRENEHGRKECPYTGYVPDLIETLRLRMEFIPNITLVPTNLTYNGLIDAIEKDDFDMVVADVTITAGRTQKVGFSSSIFDNSLRIIIREANMEPIDLLSYLKPFSFELWIALLMASIYAGFLICLLEYEHNEALQDKSVSSVIIKSMWYSIGTLLGYGADFHVRTAAGRLLTMGLYILSLVSVAAYTAKLASELTIAKSKGDISGIDDIKNGKLSSSRIGILTGTSVEEFYLREISSHSRNFYPLTSFEEMYEKLLNNIIDASIMDSGVVEYSTNKIYCNLTLIGKDFDKNAFGIVFPKDWLYQQAFDFHILSLRESGYLDVLKRRWFETNVCSRSSTTLNAMTMQSMAGLFLTFALISFLSIFLFLWIKRFRIKDYLFLLLHRKNITAK